MCEHCDERFDKKHKLNEHLFVIHEITSDAHCEKCQKFFDDKNAFKRHFKQVSLVGARRYIITDIIKGSVYFNLIIMNKAIDFN